MNHSMHIVGKFGAKVSKIFVKLSAIVIVPNITGNCNRLKACQYILKVTRLQDIQLL